MRRSVGIRLWVASKIAPNLAFYALPSSGQAMYNMNNVALPEAFAIAINLYHFLAECAHRLGGWG